MIYAIVPFGVFVVGVFFVWLISLNHLNHKIAKVQDAFDKYLENEEKAARQRVKQVGKDILVKYDRELFWLSDCKEGCEYISYGQAIGLIREHLGLDYEYVEGTKGYTRLVPKPKPEEPKDETSI